VQLRVLQHARLAEVFRRTAGILKAKGLSGDFLSQPEVKWQRNASADEAEGTTILQRLIETVVRLQEGITEQEYVVTNGRIEAALSEQSGAPLMRVSQEMGLAVAKVKDAIWRYRAELEEILHESSVRI
jgi:hypothetical protein